MCAARKPLVALSLLLILSLACSTLTEFFQTQEESGTRPGTAPPEAEQQGAEGTGAPSATEGPRRLALPPTPTPFHVVSPDDPRTVLDLAHPDHVDYFDDRATWYKYDEEAATYRFEEDHLLGIDHVPEERFVYWSYSSVESGNTYAEISATNGDCIGKDSVGLVIRVDAQVTPSGYALEVSCDGAWRFRRLRGSRSVEELVEWTPSDAIQTGSDVMSRLGVWGYQGQFVLFVNGIQVGEYIDTDYSYTTGFFAVYVRASQTYDLTATFDDFAFWHIPYQP